MKPLLILDDLVYYEYKGELVWVKRHPFKLHRRKKDIIKILTSRGY